MKERPILFNGEMVRAVLEGRKTQTRRVIKPQPTQADWNEGVFHKGAYWDIPFPCPYGDIGDRLWVRETFFHEETSDEYGDGVVIGPLYRADMPLHWDAKDTEHDEDVTLEASDYKWKPSIHMPRWASRITLEIVDIRVERIQSINPIEAEAEGINLDVADKERYPSLTHYWNANVHEFCTLWNSINAKRGFGWEKNPWVWVVEFKTL